MKNNITRDDVLSRAVEDCYRELFAKAQPEADYDNLLEEYRLGKIDEDKDGPIYNRHYISYEEYIYIINKYIEAYKIESEWKSDVGVVEDYLNEGGSKDKYIEEYTDEYGDYHPGYRGYEKVPPLKDQIINVLNNFNGGKCPDQERLVDNLMTVIMDDIATCKDFYQFNMDECKFRNTLAFGSTPTFNKETVKQWWKEHYNVDIEIEERNPLLFWEYDYYGDEIDEVMSDEYGDNWKEIWDKKWKDQVAKKKAEHDAWIKKLEEQQNEKTNN